ncbi:MAG: heavy-metal-associated domain-containing protein [Pseudomonadota bacterium]
MTRRPLSRFVRFGLALALAGAGGVTFAQKDGGVAVDNSGAFEVTGVTVDVSAKDAETARQAGWRLAQRKGWQMLSQRLTGKASSMSDSALDGLVTGIVIEDEQIGPHRYIARLGVLFDRGKAGAVLGVSTAINRSVPMLIVPLQWSGGAGRVFERATPWADAWERYRTGSSTIDYVRPRGIGPDSLLLNAGQTGRRGRGWWRTVLDQYGASDVLVAEVEMHREYPGGPIVAVFTASHGPDRKRITRFALRVGNGDAIDALMDEGVRRIDRAYQDALAAGMLKTDRLLGVRPPSEQTPKEEAQAEEEEVATPTPTESATAQSSASYSIQVETPSVASVTASEASVRGIPGVRSAVTTSLALGGISVMRVSYDGTIGNLRSQLEARGWNVQEGAGVLRIRRPGSGNQPAAATSPPGGEPNGG